MAGSDYEYDPTPRSLSGKGKKYALLVGVETYDPSVLRPLEFAEDDVLALSASLERLGVATIAMTQQNTIPARRPSTAKKINDQLEGLLKLVKSEQDTVIVVLSGHGLQCKDDPLDADQTKESFFCPEEANPKERESLVSITALSQKLAKSTAGKKLLVVDACRNEVSAKGNKALEEELDPVGRRARTEQSGMYALFSCAPKEKSWEHPELKHGVFISQMLKYLEGDADKSLYPRSQISITQMAAFASRETTEFVYRRLNQEQTPELIGKGTDWSLGRTGPPLVMTNSIGMKFVLIPEGEFEMGDEAEAPVHRVRIAKPFYMGMYEVTQSQYERVMGTNPSYFSANGDGKGKVAGLNTSDFPVEDLNWFNAQEFYENLEKLSEERQKNRKYRLPTEAEWEYACRAGTKSKFHFGDVLDGSQANVNGKLPEGTKNHGPYLERTTTVGSYAPNAFGLFDMHGNVREYCYNSFEDFDGLDLNYSKRGRFVTDDPSRFLHKSKLNPKDKGYPNILLRGGSWISDAWYARSAHRYDEPSSGYSSRFNGFRLVLVP